MSGDRLQMVVEDTIYHGQFGYRTNMGCMEHLFCIDNLIRQSKSKHLTMSLLDMTADFDRVCSRKIWDRLIELGCPSSFMQCFQFISSCLLRAVAS